MQPNSIADAIRIAIEHQRAGNLANAEQLYRQVLQIEPANADAWWRLGQIAIQIGKIPVAIGMFSRAAASAPSRAEIHASLGDAYRAVRDHRQAIVSYDKSLSCDPKLITALFQRGMTYREVGNPAAARNDLAVVVELDPKHALGWANLGLSHAELGNVDEAIRALTTAACFLPNLSLIHFALANLHHQQKDFEAAVAEYENVIRLDPKSVEARINLAVCQRDMGRLENAEATLQVVLAAQPNCAEAISNLSVVYLREGRVAQAVELSRRAATLLPHDARSYVNLGISLCSANELGEAIEAFRRACELENNCRLALGNYATTVLQCGQVEASLATYDRLAILAPDDPAYASARLQTMHYDPRTEPDALLAAHRLWDSRFGRPADRFLSTQQIQTLCGRPRPKSDRLKIGYVSADLHDHPVARFLLPLLERHDRSRFEIFCYADVVNSTAATSAIRANCDSWREIQHMSDDAIAKRIHDDGIDILVDLGSHSASNRLPVFARKPAPIQATYLAYPSTTGLSAIDYRLTDPYLDPPGTDGDYSERSIRLPSTYWCYRPPPATPEVASLPALAQGHVTFGSMNNFAKVSKPTLDAWISLLQQTPGSRLLLHCKNGPHRDTIVKKSREAGVDPKRIEYITVLPLNEYLAAYGRIDVALDTWPYCGGTTTCDALWMGVPVVTLTGRLAVNRSGSSILSNAGFTDWIASTSEQYIDIARSLAGDLISLRDTRAILRSRMSQSPLMDEEGFARAVESAYQAMWDDMNSRM